MKSMTPINLSDEHILTSSLSNPDTFGLLIDRYQEAFFRAAYSVVRQKEEAEDIVQEAFTNMYLHGGKFEKQAHASFKSWAYRIVINTAISHYRKLKRARERFAPLDPEIYDNLAGDEDFAKDAERRIFTDELLGELPEDLRRVVEAHYMEGTPYKAIATAEGIPLSTLKMRLFRAKKLLKNLL
ncbi:MAG: RNA polymerase, sigma-24 subunit, RpoE [Parcubacteria group bacterium Gr01-1014_29]|nr:MAG: RNA polymerase, sigma-24 subunit, RpoE [Parcubacteria group bacterium Gr01-1014_29]